MLTIEKLLSDPWVKKTYGDSARDNYIHSDFLAGVDYGEEKTAQDILEWLEKTLSPGEVILKEDLIERYKKHIS